MMTLTGVVAINDQARQYPPVLAPPQAAAQLPPGMMGPRRAVDTEGVQFRVAVVASDEARKVLGEQLGAAQGERAVRDVDASSLRALHTGRGLCFENRSASLYL